MGRRVLRGTRAFDTDLLCEGAEKIGVSLSPPQISSLRTYLDELVRWNQRMNLTGIRDRQGMIVRHLLDSLAALAVLPFLHASCPAYRILDAGTGAGFPGIPLRICRPQLRLTLVEARRKKAAFLHTVCGRLALKGVQVLPERLEGVAKEPSHRQNYDLLTARGIRPSTLLGPASALLGRGGRMVIWAAGDLKAADFPGWVLDQALPYPLPFEDRRRQLQVLRQAPRSGRE